LRYRNSATNGLSAHPLCDFRYSTFNGRHRNYRITLVVPMIRLYIQPSSLSARYQSTRRLGYVFLPSLTNRRYNWYFISYFIFYWHFRVV